MTHTRKPRPERPFGENESVTVSIQNLTSATLTPVIGTIKMTHGKISSGPGDIPPGATVQAFVAEGDLDSFFGTQGQLQYQMSSSTVLTVQFNSSYSGDNDYVYAGMQAASSGDDPSGFSATISNYNFPYVNVTSPFQFFPIITVASTVGGAQDPGPLTPAFFSGLGTDNWVQYVLTIDNQTTSPMTLNEVSSPLGQWMQPNVIQVVLPQTSVVAIISFGGTIEDPQPISVTYNLSYGVSAQLSYNPIAASTPGTVSFSTANQGRFQSSASTPVSTTDGNGNVTYTSTFTISAATSASDGAPAGGS
jgi:hypothetical protein